MTWESNLDEYNISFSLYLEAYIIVQSEVPKSFSFPQWLGSDMEGRSRYSRRCAAQLKLEKLLTLMHWFIFRHTSSHMNPTSVTSHIIYNVDMSCIERNEVPSVLLLWKIMPCNQLYQPYKNKPTSSTTIIPGIDSSVFISICIYLNILCFSCDCLRCR